jgi:hypothetical protein
MAWSTAGYIKELEDRNYELREQISQLRLRTTNLERELQLLRNKETGNVKDTAVAIDTVPKPK